MSTHQHRFYVTHRGPEASDDTAMMKHCQNFMHGFPNFQAWICNTIPCSILALLVKQFTLLKIQHKVFQPWLLI